ncbi:hypothetical protein [Candidatus Thioglobus sp.]|uniref:hypothetical protein n=1 Tax=Candidatus Thioglobus sp. TaxID=2026721 RepID=UPI003D0BCDD1
MSKIQTTFIVILLAVSTSIFANKDILYTDKNITIYTDNTIVQTGKTTAPVFKPSSTWVEEDFFTQQEKYCEVDSLYGKKLKQSLIKSR